LPIHYKRDHIIDLFAQYGALVSLELPLKNIEIENELKDKTNHYDIERKTKRNLETGRAQKFVRDQILENE